VSGIDDQFSVLRDLIDRLFGLAAASK
jgi:hypothetical protein